MILGAGRIKKEDSIDHLAGIILEKSLGDYVAKGDILATLYTSNESLFENAKAVFESAISYSEGMPPKSKLIYKILK